MNRLTKRNEDGHAYYLRCFESPCNGNGCKIPKCSLDDKICERLAAYEDTGLEPEEIKDNMEMFHAYRHICAGMEPEEIEALTREGAEAALEGGGDNGQI